MATSRIYLYPIPDLVEENNFVVEEMPSYLAHFSTAAAEIEGFQWQRLELNKVIKIDYSQLLNCPTPATQESFNYVSIQTEDDEGHIDPLAGIAYYFIEKIEQRAKFTIALYLKLDCLNTFYSYWKGNMTPATYIARAHKDRFFVANKTTLNATLVHKYDKTPEGDNFPLVWKGSGKTVIYDKAGGDTDVNPLKFYLVYRTANDGRPCLDLCANRELLISAASSGGAAVEYVRPGDFVAGRYYYLVGDFSFRYRFTGDYGPENSQTYTATNGILQFNNGSITFINNGEAKSFSFDISITILKGRRVYYSTEKTLDTSEIITFPYATINAGTYTGQYLGDIAQLDKTDSRIVKVIECPYSPIEYAYNPGTGVYTFDQTIFAHQSENEYPPYLRTYDLGKELPERSIRRAAELNFRTLATKAAILGLKTTPSAPMYDDPKLQTSPYYSRILVYDSFSFQIKYEDLAAPIGTTYTETGFDFTYKQSANVSSALLFRVEPKPSTNGATDYMKFSQAEENFPTIVAASRNNELALFSSEYLNYLKNGYNYEKKKREENLALQGTLAGLQTLGAILSFALTPATGGASAAAGAGLAVGAATTFANMGVSAHQSGEELNQKIKLLKAQSYNVSNIDDLDLFNCYGGNKAILYKYQLRDADLSRVKTRFQYFGYAVDSYGDPYILGYLDSRFNFNYLKCDPVFRQGNIPIPADFLDDIAERLRAGITIFHRRFYDINGSDDYWLNRDYENIETSVVASVEETTP